MYGQHAGLDGGAGGRGSDLHQKISIGVRIPERSSVGVRRQLPHSAAAAGSADPEDPADGERRGGPLCGAHQTVGCGGQAGFRHCQDPDYRVPQDEGGDLIWKWQQG